VTQRVCYMFITGVQVIQVDLSDPTSCREALQGAYGVFLVTATGFDSASSNIEIQQVMKFVYI